MLQIGELPHVLRPLIYCRILIERCIPTSGLPSVAFNVNVI